MLVSMISGALVVMVLYLTGIFSLIQQEPIGAASKFRPYFLLGMDPLIWGIVASAFFGVAGSLLTEPLDDELVSRMFDVGINPDSP